MGLEGWWAASYLVLWLLVVILCLVVVALARQIGTLLLRVESRGALELDDEGPPLEEATAPTETVDAAGRPVVLGGPGEAQLLLFVSPGCRICRSVLPSVDAVARAGRLFPYVVTDVDREETLSDFGDARISAPVVPGLEIARAFGVPGTPYVVVLDSTGVAVAKGTVNNLEQNGRPCGHRRPPRGGQSGCPGERPCARCLKGRYAGHRFGLPNPPAAGRSSDGSAPAFSP